MYNWIYSWLNLTKDVWLSFTVYIKINSYLLKHFNFLALKTWVEGNLGFNVAIMNMLHSIRIGSEYSLYNQLYGLITCGDFSRGFLQSWLTWDWWGGVIPKWCKMENGFVWRKIQNRWTPTVSFHMWSHICCPRENIKPLFSGFCTLLKLPSTALSLGLYSLKFLFKELSYSKNFSKNFVVFLE